MATMKKLFLLILFLNAYWITEAQDVIKKINGEVIRVNVKHITEKEVQCATLEGKRDSIFSLQKKELNRIDFENGTVVVFVEDTFAAGSSPDTSMFGKGQWDARRYYTGYKPAATGTLITTIISPVYGLIPAVICSSSPPKAVNLNYPVNVFSKNEEYLKGYQGMANKMKSRKVWKNYGIGAGIWAGAMTVIVIIITSTVSSVDYR